MATLEDTGSHCQSLLWRATSAQNSNWTNTPAKAVRERWNRGSWQRPAASSFSSRTLQPPDDETPELVNLRRLIAEQSAALAERRRSIETTDRQIEEYERCIHNDRCAQDGYDYLQRAYNLTSSHNDDEEDLVSRRRQRVTESTIAAYYTQASNEIKQRLIDVEAQLVDVASNCERIASAECDDGKHPSRVDDFDRSACFDVNHEAQLVVGESAHRRRAFQLDTLRMELARADDTHRRQLVEHHRLSSAIEEVQSQLGDEEIRLVAMLAECDESSSSSYVSDDIQKLSQPLKAKTKNSQSAECHRRVEEDRQITRQCNPDCQASVSPDNNRLESSTSDVTRLPGYRKCKHYIYDKDNIANKSREILAYSDSFASDPESEDAGFGSLPDDDDPLVDCHRLVTLV